MVGIEVPIKKLFVRGAFCKEGNAIPGLRLGMGLHVTLLHQRQICTNGQLPHGIVKPSFVKVVLNLSIVQGDPTVIVAVGGNGVKRVVST